MSRAASALRVVPRALAGQQRRAVRRLARHDPAVRADHRRQRTGLWRYIAGGSLGTLASAPVIYAMIVPFALLDAGVAVYQAICFRAWGIRPVRRRACFVIDRHELAYLNALQKVNCLYCSYANGVIAFAREVTARTEQYWCPIKHATRVRQPHDRYDVFAPYGDAPAYRQRQPSLRAALKR